MQIAHMTLDVTGPSDKLAQHCYVTPTLFAAVYEKDDDQIIKLITSTPVNPAATLIDVIGVLTFGKGLDSVELRASIATPVLVTPDWGDSHPWSFKEGLVTRHRHITLTGALGDDPESRMVGDRQVVNFDLAVKSQLAVLAGQFDAPPSWFQLACWGGLTERAGQLQKGQTLQFAEGLLSFRHWGEQGDRVSVGVNVLRFIKGALSSGIPSRDGDVPPESEAPPMTHETPPVEAQAPAEAGVPSSYNDIPY